MLLLILAVGVAAPSIAAPQREDPLPKLIAHTGHPSQITAVAFAHRKPLLVAGSFDGGVKVWDIATGLETSQVANGGGAVHGLALFPSDQTLAVASEDGKVRLWELTSRTCTSTLDAGGPVSLLSLSEDGKWLAAATNVGRIIVWNTLTLDVALHLRDVERISTLTFAPDDSLISVNREGWNTDSPHGSIRWAIPSGVVLRERKGVVSIALNADGTAGLWGIMPTKNEPASETLEDSREATIARPEFTTTQEEIVQAQLSPDGSILATVTMDMSGNAHEFTFVRLIDAHTGSILATLKGRDESAEMNDLAEFSPDGKMLAVVAGNDISFYNTTTHRREGQISWAAVSNHIKFSPRGHWLAMIVNRTLKLWDLSDGSLAMNLGPVAGAARIAFSNDDRYVASWNFDPETLNLRSELKRYFVKVWDLQDGGEVRTEMEDGPFNDVAFSPDGTEFAYSVNSVVQLRETSTGKVQATLPENLDYATSHWLDFSDDGSGILDFSDRYNIHRWNIPSGSLRSARQESGAPSDLRESVDGPPGSQTFAYSDYENVVRTWDFSSNERSELPIKDASVGALAFSPDMQTLAVGGDPDATLVLCSLRPLRERTRISLLASVRSLGYSPDGRWLAVGLSNGETELINTATNEVGARMFVMGSSSDWMMITPSGEFDGSERGLHTLLAWQFDRRQFPVDRFFRDFYATHLLPRILSGETPSPNLRIEALGFPPSVHITSTRVNRGDVAMVDVNVRAHDEGGGLKEISLFQNRRLIETKSVKMNGKRFADAHFHVRLADGENRFDATAFNEHEVESEEDVAWIDNGSGVQKPVLHVLAIGINRYSDADLNLEFARPDSEAVAAAFRAHAGSLFSRVDTIMLTDREATVHAIRKGLKELKSRSSPSDAVVLYLAGHGKNINGRFFFYAHDARSTSTAGEHGVLSGDEIGSAMLENPALKQLMIFDTCESGAAVQQIAKLSHPSFAPTSGKSKVRIIGINILSATTDVERERETPAIGHSRLAMAVLEAMRSESHVKSSVTGGSTITVASLIEFVKAKMAQIPVARDTRFHGSMSEQSGADFPIGIR